MPSNLCDAGTPVKPVNANLGYGTAVAEPSKDAASSDKGIYTTFDAFLKQAIRE